MLTVGCVYFEYNPEVIKWPVTYTTEWVDKLYRGVKRNITVPFEFYCLVDKPYDLEPEIKQLPLQQSNFLGLMELFKLPGRVLAMGIDAVITGSLDHLATYPGALALHRCPFRPELASNGVWMFNDGAWIWDKFEKDERKHECLMAGKISELQWMRDRLKGYDFLDELYPGQVVSYKGHWKRGKCDKSNVRIVYFHGREKMTEIKDDFLYSHWI